MFPSLTSKSCWWLLMLGLLVQAFFPGIAHAQVSGPLSSSLGSSLGSSLAPGTSVEPGVVVFKLRPEVKAKALRHSIEHPALHQALARIGAGALNQQFPQAVAAAKGRTAEGVDLTLIYQISYPATLPLTKVRQALLASGAVEYVEPLYRREIMFQPNDLFADSTRASCQYYLKNICAFRAWDFERGDTSVVIGLTDTGTQFSHQDLKGQFAFNYADPINGLDDDHDGYIDNFRGWDIADQDNDPSVDATNVGNSQPKHGVLVSGTMAAIANNVKGIAGAGFHCRILPIKVFPTTTTGRFKGYDGIVYAADHGCKVINCSWGGAGYSSQYEQDIITYATVNRDAVVVAAAGNTNAELEFYPASYNGVISVAALERTGVKGTTNTYSYRVTVSAPGKMIVTTSYSHDSSYAYASGSSFASPLVAATAALVRHRFPTLTAAQVIEHVRVTSNPNIYALAGNAPYQGLLGHGQVDMLRAVVDTAVRSVRATATRCAMTTGSGNVGGDDTLLISSDFRNYLAPLRRLTVSLTSSSPYVRVLDDVFESGPLSSSATTNDNARPLRIVLLAGLPLYSSIVLRYAFNDSSGYADEQYLRLEVNPDYITLDANRVRASVTSRGKIGFDQSDRIRGEGVQFNHSASLLNESGLMVGWSETHVSDMLRTEPFGLTDQDFATVEQVHFTAMPGTDQAATGIFQDAGSGSQANVRVVQRAWAHSAPEYDRSVFLSYDIINQAPDTLKAGYAGMFADWDIIEPYHNATGWDSIRGLSYAYHVTQDTLYAGIKLLTAGHATTYAIDNATYGGAFDPTDGLSTREKYLGLVGGPSAPTVIGNNQIGTDVAQVVSAALPLLAPGDTARVAFTIVMGHDLASLQAAADTAQALYDALQRPVAAPLVSATARCGPGSILLTATGAPANGSYRWYNQPIGGSVLSDSLPGTLTDLFLTPVLTTTTTYYVSAVTRLGRESNRVGIAAVVHAVPVATIDYQGSTSLCAGDSIALTATGGTSYRWSTGATQPTITVAQSGTYSVVVTGAGGCEATPPPVTVAVASSTISASGSPTFCQGDSVVLTATSAGTYQWSTGDTTASITVRQSGSYTVQTVQTTSGACPATSAPFTVTVTQPASAAFTYGNAPVCQSAALPVAAVLTAGAVAGAFTASPAGLVFADPATGLVDVQQSLPGTYTVTNTVAGGGVCAPVATTASLTILAPPPVPVIGQQPQAGGVLLTSSAPTGNQWLLNGAIISGATNSSLWVATSISTPAGSSYAVRVTNGSCSTTSDELTVSLMGVADAAALPALNLSLYPNPTADGMLTIALQGTHQPAALEVFDATGRSVYRTTLPADQPTPLDLRALPGGVYSLRVTTPTSTAAKRLVRQ